LAAGVVAVVVLELVTNGRFRTSAQKAKNGFIGPENCFVAQNYTKQCSEKSMFSVKCNPFSGSGLMARSAASQTAKTARQTLVVH
jgi:hypothetical protein